MANWEYRAYDAELNLCDGEEKAGSFPELALKLRNRGLQILEAVKLNDDATLAAKRLSKMRARITPPEDEFFIPQTEKPVKSAIHKLLSWLIPPFLKRSNESTKPDQDQ